jgi:Uncharacterized protein conserved in bacteria (DUF2125)
MSYSHRFFLYAPIAVFLAILGAIGVYWWMTASVFFKSLDAANGREIAPGVTLHFTSHSDGGFPFRIESVMENVRVDVATSYGPATWQAEHFALHALSYGRNQILYEAAGRQTLSWTDSEHRHHVWTFVPGSMRASSIVAGGKLARFDLDIIGIGSPELAAGRAQIHMRRDPQKDAIDFALMGDVIHLAPDLQSGFGDTIKTLRLNGSFAPGSPLTPLLDGKSDWRSAFENWRKANGSFAIDQFEMAWGKLDAIGQGKLALDVMRQPQGTLALKISGYQAFLKTAGAGSSDTPLASALIADQSPNSPETLSVPLNFKNGIVTAGPTAGGVLNPLY